MKGGVYSIDAFNLAGAFNQSFSVISKQKVGFLNSQDCNYE